MLKRFKSTLKIRVIPVFIILLFSFYPKITLAQLQDPASFFGFTPGEDRKLFDYKTLMTYLHQLDAASPKMLIEEIGQSEMGKPMYLVFISSEKNINNLRQLKKINRELALNYNLDPKQKEEMVKDGKVFFLFTLSMHSNEVAPSQSAPLIAWEMIRSKDPKILKILDNTVYMMVPSHNPDGMNMIVEHYKKYLGTKYEGSTMPGVYHKYVGHNINRDFVTLNMKENQNIAKIYSTEWFPQVMVEKHQMGSTGPRYYVSPPHDPISENIQPGIWNWTRIFGSRALNEMTNEGLTGISVSYLFDNYWPGGTATSKWKGVVSMLSEAAGVDIASPIYVEPNELRVSGKGLAEYKISINFPAPWPGGWWRLSDLVKYEMANTISYLHTAAIHREEILRSRNDITLKEVELGQTQPPYYYVLPAKQHDAGEMAALVNLLLQHGVNVFKLKGEIQLENRLFDKGSMVIPLAQPFRAFIKEVMESQKFPVRHYTTGGPMIRPYDITSWSLPLHRGVEAVEINTKTLIQAAKLEKINTPFSFWSKEKISGKYLLFSANNNESYLAAFKAISLDIPVFRTEEDHTAGEKRYPKGSFLIEIQPKTDLLLEDLTVSPAQLPALPKTGLIPLKIPRIGLVETWFHDMDAGWTRFLFDRYHIPYTTLRPADFQTTDLSGNFDLIIFPDQSKSVLFSGRQGSSGNYNPPRYPADYAKGMEKKGMNNLLSYIERGGKVISWANSTALFFDNLEIEYEDGIKDEFRLPVRNIAENLSKNGLDITGSLMRTDFKKDHPLTWGMPAQAGIFHRGNPVFATNFPIFDTDRRVIGAFSEDKILMSGFAENEKLLAGNPVMVWVKKAEGQIILFGFAPQFRGSTSGTYKLLFNALLLP